MGITAFPNGVSSWGAPMLPGVGIPVGGSIYFVDATNGSDSNEGTTPEKAVKKLSVAYDKCTSAKNDIIYIIPGATGITETAGITWSKTYTHLIGLHPGFFNNRCRVTTSTVGISPLINVSGQGCIFANVLISQEGSHATSNAYALQVSGHRCTFINVGIRNIGASAVVDNSHRSLYLYGAYDLLFKHCQIGEDTYDAVTAASAVIECASTGGGKYIFEDCVINGAGSSSAVFLKTGLSSHDGGFILFKDCLFNNKVGGTMDAMTQAFSLGGGNDPVYLKHCMVAGATNLETSDAGTLYGINAQAAATGELAVLLTG